METSQRALVRGPTFIRLLARLADIDVVPCHAPLADRLSQWIDWTRAVALSRALDGKLPAVGLALPAFDEAEEAAYTRTHMSLHNAIVGGDAVAAPVPTAAQGIVEYAGFRQHYLAMQRAMQVATGKLRGRLRDMLATTSADMARLAEVDALMEQVLSPREHRLLAAVPALLGEHFERMQQAAHVASGHPPAANADAWLQLFRKDMQGVLLAELDVRFHPLEGLLAALRTHSQGRHVQTFS